MPNHDRFTEAVAVDYPGSRYVLGRTVSGYAIWPAAGGPPLRTFALSDEGWAEAWRGWQELEGPAQPPVPTRWERGQPITLGPMRAGQVIGGALRMYRLHVSPLLGIVAPVMVGVYVLIIVLNVATVREVVVDTPFGRVPQLQAPPWVTLVTNVLNALVIQFLTAAVARAASDAFGGGRVRVGAVYRFAVLKIFPVGWVLILTYLVFVLPFIPGAVVLWLGVRLGMEALGAISVVLFLAAVPVIFFLFVRLVLAPVVVALEDLRGGAALGRAWRLSIGVGWRILGTYILAVLIAAGVQLVLALLVGIPVALSSGQFDITTLAVFLAVSGLALLITTPFLNLVVVLLYADGRIRSEGSAEGLWTGTAQPVR